MKLETYTQTDVFATLQAEWNELVFRSTANCIFSTWEWQSTWWNVYQPGQLWVISCRDEQGRLIGIAPWFIGTNAESKRFVATIGCKEVTDYLELIIDAEHVEPVLDQLAQYVAQNTAVFDYLDLCNIPENSITLTRFPSHLEKYGFSVTTEHEDVCPVVELPDDWTAYLNLLDKKQRHELRRKLRRTQGSNTDMDWYIVGPEHNLEEEVSRFLEMMAASDPSKAEFLADPDNLSFFRKITAALHHCGWLQMSFLRINAKPAAAYLNFDYNGHILVYNSGLRPDEYGHLSPGIVLLAHNIQYAIETRHTVFDFLQGDEIYKYHLGGQNRAVLNLTARFKEQQP